MTRTRLAACAGVVAIAFLAASCGWGSSSEGSSVGAEGEAQSVLGELGSLRPGERLIKSSRAPRFSGPYTFASGYVLRFRQAQAGRLAVALESRRGSRSGIYQLLVDTSARRGTARLAVSGKLHVHVIRAAGPYMLRFTPGR